MKITIPLTLVAMCSLALPTLPSAQTAYEDTAGNSVVLPQGDLSFADTVVAYTAGTGQISETARTADRALGPPDFSGNVSDGSFLTLGCDGVVDLQFVDNALIDIPGPDLYIFEVGPRAEGTLLAISEDGQTWTNVGQIDGGRAEVDIASFSAPGLTYRFVRLTDDGVDCGTRFAGADIDAVAAIGAALRFTLDASVLFDVDSFDLRAEASDALSEIAAEIAAARPGALTIIGHTDNTGDAAYNQSLSLNRANAVRDALASTGQLGEIDIQVDGRGESEPVASNDTDAGRQQNRRVEIVVRTE